MARRCALTGKKPQAGNTTQHRRGGLWYNRAQKKKRRFLPNLQKKTITIFVDGKPKRVKVKLSTRALRTLNKQMSAA